LLLLLLLLLLLFSLPLMIQQCGSIDCTPSCMRWPTPRSTTHSRLLLTRLPQKPSY
jgi:hypothetical protein